MTSDDVEDTAPGLPGQRGRGQTASSVKPASKVRRVAFWAGLFAVLYGLTLFVLMEDWFLLGIPGIIGMAVVGAMFSTGVLKAPFRKAVPYATDGTDHRGPVAYHRSSLVKRYLLILAVAALLIAVVVLVKSDYLIPLAPLAVMLFVFGTYGWLGELVTVSQCARALKVYPLSFRAPVKVLNRVRNGERALRLPGSDGQGSPKLVGRQLIGDDALSEDLSGGVWFAGDELFGGVLLVPGSGQLVWVRPQDAPALQRERESAAAERKGKAKQAGLGRNLK